MIPPDTLPIHLVLALVQSGLWNAGSNSWSGGSNEWLNTWMKFLPRPKHPLEDQTHAALDQWQNLVEQQSEQLKKLLGEIEDTASSRRMTGFPPASGGRSQNKPGITEPFNPDFLNEVAAEASTQTRNFLEGITAYTSTHYTRPEKNYRVLWQRGAARLIDLAPEKNDAVAVLMIPSLINKFYILDLYPGASLAEYLLAQGYRPLILDWGVPGTAEQDFTTADYITAYAIPALEAFRAAHDGPITLLGYCMGGIFALAVAQLAGFLVDGLILLATPWDFSAEDTPRVLLDPAAQTLLRATIGGMNPVPNFFTQTLFHLINPWHVQKKYAKFLTLTGTARQHFLAVEEWINDGVPLVRAVAEECFVDWPQGNILANHQWKVGRKWIAPEAISCPALAFIPEHDAIVPKGTALPLTELLKRCEVKMPTSGHVSMVVGERAEAECWQPISQWLNARF
ncbi:MAG: alpha/beta fold hydrolase [Alphaproteobacteria bacterium]